MTTGVAITALPYVISIIAKLSSLVLDRKSVIGGLEDLASLPKPRAVAFDLTHDQREVIAEHVSHSLLKTTAVVTAIASYGIGALIVLLNRGVSWMPWALLALFILGMTLIWWVLPRKVFYFSLRTCGVERGTILVLAFCAYDLLLAALSMASASSNGANSQH